MIHHRKKVQAFLEEKLACEPKKDEIIVKLLHGGGYEMKFKAALLRSSSECGGWSTSRRSKLTTQSSGVHR